MWRNSIDIANAKTGLLAGWAALGFFRGTQSYRYQCSKDKTNLHLYSNQFMYGLAGVFCYVNPLVGIVVVYKEIYRLEVNLRNIEHAKAGNYYNEVL